MPKNQPPFNATSSSSSNPAINIRKKEEEEKKRKQTSVTATSSVTRKAGKDGTRGQLEDILATLEGGVSGMEKGKERERKKVKRDVVVGVSGEGKGSVSALDLLMGMSSSGGAREDVEGKGKGSAGEKGEVTGKKGQGTVGAKAVESGGEEKLKPKVIDSDRKLQLGGKAVDASGTVNTNSRQPKYQRPERHTLNTLSTTLKPHTSPTTTTTAQPHASTPPSASTSPPPPTHPPPLPHLLKTLKHHLRHLTLHLTRLETSLHLISQLWYKNASQFKNALWWSQFNSVRRSLGRLLRSTRAKGAEEEQGVGWRVVVSLTKVYAGLGGGYDAFDSVCAAVEGGYPAVPKFDRKPSTHTMESFLAKEEGRRLVRDTLGLVEEVRGRVEVVRGRVEGVGRGLVVHLNTPPAPTFAVVVMGVLAVVAGVYGEVVGVGEGDGEGEGEGGKGMLETLDKIEGLVRDVM